MADVLIYWRDFAANRGTSPGKAFGLPDDDGGVLVWHSSAKCIAELQPGDRMWMVTSGKGLREDAEQAALLVGVWAVREAIARAPRRASRTLAPSTGLRIMRVLLRLRGAEVEKCAV